MEHQLATKSMQKEQTNKAPSSSLSPQTSPDRALTHPVLRLQRAIGNQAVQRMVRSGQVDDRGRTHMDTQEFGASTVVETPSQPVLQRKCACSGASGEDDECAECKEKHLMQRHSSPNKVSPLSSPSSSAMSSVPLQRQQAGTLEQGSQPPPDQTFRQRWGSQIEMLKRMYKEQRYGCWCGPGHVCEEERDNIDACCKRHDLAYDALGVSGSETGPGQVGMWSIEGLRRTVRADLTFVASLELTAFDPHFYGPAAAHYRAAAQLIFGTRALIGAWITANILPIPIIATP